MCHFMRGTLVGSIEAAFQTEFESAETQCMAMGEEYCEFEFKVRK
jgi:predicted hydrocarbon binding protein